MTDPHEGPIYERGPGVLMEDLQLMADLERTRGEFLTSAAVLYADPTSEQQDIFHGHCNEWLDHVRQYVDYMIRHDSSIASTLTRLEIIAAQYLYEDRAINEIFAIVTGNTHVFYPTSADTNEIAQKLIEPDDEDCEPEDAIVMNFMESLTADVENFELISLAQYEVTTFGPDEAIKLLSIETLPVNASGHLESRKKRIVRQTLKVAGNVASMTLAVYLGNKLSQKR